MTAIQRLALQPATGKLHYLFGMISIEKKATGCEMSDIWGILIEPASEWQNC